MREEDKTIFEYRKGKEIAFTDMIIAERMCHDYQKGNVYTSSAGWIEYSVYTPFNKKSETKLPVVFMFHGGGFVLGYYEQEGRYCRQLADWTNCIFINVDYALAPEFKFPIPILSSYEAIELILEKAELYGIDKEKVMVMGNSSGGAIAAALCLLNREKRAIHIIGQILDYAPLDQSLNQTNRISADETKGVSQSRALQYMHWYFKDAKDMDDPLASPARNAQLHNLPRMLIISAALDTLRNEEELYATKCKKAGNDVDYAVMEGVGHGFTHSLFNTYDKAKAEEAWKLMAKFIINTVNQ